MFSWSDAPLLNGDRKERTGVQKKFKIIYLPLHLTKQYATSQGRKKFEHFEYFKHKGSGTLIRLYKENRKSRDTYK